MWKRWCLQQHIRKKHQRKNNIIISTDCKQNWTQNWTMWNSWSKFRFVALITLHNTTTFSREIQIDQKISDVKCFILLTAMIWFKTWAMSGLFFFPLETTGYSRYSVLNKYLKILVFLLSMIILDNLEFHEQMSKL